MRTFYLANFVPNSTRMVQKEWLKAAGLQLNIAGIFYHLMGNTCCMKKHLTVEQAKQMILQLKGRKVSLKLNKGRNRIKKCKGVVVEVHSNVFVVQLLGDIFDRISCSYVDVICGEVVICEQLGG